MLNNTLNQRPRIYTPGVFTVPEVSKMTLKNGLDIYLFNDPMINTIRFEWCFPSGRLYEHHPMTSKFTATLLRESSEKYTSFENASFFDYYGSSFSSHAGMDYGNVSFLCLNKYIKPLFERYLEMLMYPAFHNNDLEIIKRNSITKLLRDLDDNDYVAYRILTEKIFGNGHPYGYNSSPELIQSINRSVIHEHWEKTYFTASSFVLISGKIESDILDFMVQKLENIPLKPSPSRIQTPFDLVTEDVKMSPKKNQCSIRMGHASVERSHPDYDVLFFFNTILGGYFNARLNQVIREKKGLTYGIYSTHDAFRAGGLFMVAADTSSAQADEVVHEVKNQIYLLLKEGVGPAERKRVKSYLLGNMLNNFDGVFNRSDTMRHCLIEGVSMHHIQRLINKINDITSEEIIEVGKKHIRLDDMITIVTQ